MPPARNSRKSKRAPQRSLLYYGDCVEVMREKLPAESVDLIYLDPPFNSDANYNITYGRWSGINGQFLAFADTWVWALPAEQRLKRILAAAHPARNFIEAQRLRIGKCGMLAYLTFMAEALVQMHRVLKASGSIYLHCDPAANYYLRMLMDDIFGVQNFRNEIAWCYESTSGATRHYPRKHDTLLFYAKGAKNTFNQDAIRIPYKLQKMPQRKNLPERNRGGSGKWKEQSETTLKKRHQAGKVPEDHWLMTFGPNSPERIGYPTQKPLALLRRIIQASSNPGDTVLDPFVGSGTTANAAAELGRRYIGMDVSTNAIRISAERMRRAGFPKPQITGIPQDMLGAQNLAKEDRYKFELWAVQTVPGFWQDGRRGGDGGKDGIGLAALPVVRTKNGVKRKTHEWLLEVKSGKVGIAMLRAFAATVESWNESGAAGGVFMTMHALKRTPAVMEVLLGVQRGGKPALLLWSVEEYFTAVKKRLPPSPPELPDMKDPRSGETLNKEDFVLQRLDFDAALEPAHEGE